MKTSDTTTVHVHPRLELRKKVQKLLIDNILPGNISGLGQTPQPISIPAKDFSKYLAEAGGSGFFFVEGEGVARTPVMIAEIQTDSLSGKNIHVSLQRIDLKQKVTSEVAIELTGVLDVKDANAILVRQVLEVEALPENLPETFVIDISQFKEIGDAVYVKDLGIDTTKVEVLLSEEEQVDPLVLVKEIKEEVIEEEPTAETTAEGETPAETTAAAEAEDKEQFIR